MPGIRLIGGTFLHSLGAARALQAVGHEATLGQRGIDVTFQTNAVQGARQLVAFIDQLPAVSLTPQTKPADNS